MISKPRLALGTSLILLTFGSACNQNGAQTTSNDCVGPVNGECACNVQNDGSYTCSDPYQTGVMKYIPALNAWGVSPDMKGGCSPAYKGIMYYAVSGGLDESLKFDGMPVAYNATDVVTPLAMGESCTPDQPFYPGGCEMGQVSGDIFTLPETIMCPAIPASFSNEVVDSSGNSIDGVTVSISFAPEDGSPVQSVSEAIAGQFVPSGPGIYTVTLSAPGFISQTVTWKVVRNICWFELFGPTTITLQSSS